MGPLDLPHGGRFDYWGVAHVDFVSLFLVLCLQHNRWTTKTIFDGTKVIIDSIRSSAPDSHIGFRPVYFFFNELLDTSWLNALLDGRLAAQRANAPAGEEWRVLDNSTIIPPRSRPFKVSDNRLLDAVWSMCVTPLSLSTFLAGDPGAVFTSVGELGQLRVGEMFEMR